MTTSPRYVTLLLALTVAAQAAFSGPAAPPASTPARIDQATRARLSGVYGTLPLSFERNQGQSDDQVKFLSRGSGYSLFLTSTEAVLA